MSKKWPMMIMPTVGVLMFVTALAVLIEDVIRFRKGQIQVHAHELEDIETYQRMAGIDADEVAVEERTDAH